VASDSQDYDSGPLPDTLDGVPPPREPATLASVRGPSNSVSDAPVVFPEHYEFIQWLGQGGMGLVAKARDPGLGREVAIKLIRPELSDRDSVRSAFEREAHAMARVRHRNVIEIYAAGQIDRVPYFVMELVKGESLADWMDRQGNQALPVDVALGLLTQICAGVDAIHCAGAVHRDLKPANVLIGAGMRVAVTDLGLVQLDGQRSFSKGTIAGTPEYLSPELILHGFGHDGDDKPADVYALGIIAYELLTGQLPFEGLSPEEVLEMQMVMEPTAPSALRPELPVVFDEVVLAALAKEPKERPDATEFARSFAAARAKAARGYSAKRESFLIVDDDPAFARWAKSSLGAAYPLSVAPSSAPS
jgi:serine/threonine-protein kinase